jgi:hypothetical protein
MLGPAPVRRLGLGFGLLYLVAGCGTKAEGISECREIEQARCSAATACGFAQVDDCRRYYRDHCLHGLAIEAISQAQVDACAQELDRAGRCAVAQGGATLASACSEPVATATAASSTCDVVQRPETALACAFLAPPPLPVPPAPAAAPPAPLVDAGGS